MSTTNGHFGGECRQPTASIWPKRVLAPETVRSPVQVFQDAVDELKSAGSRYSARVSSERRGENGSFRRDLTLIEPSGRELTVATVEYPQSGYPAKLILGEVDPIYLQVVSEEELVTELANFFASLRFDR